MIRTARALGAVTAALTLLLSAGLVAPPALARGGKTVTAKFPTTTAMKLVDADPGITSVLVVNNGSTTVYLGNAPTVTAAAAASTDGVPLYANNYIAFTGVTDALYGVTSSGTGNLRITVVRGGGTIEGGALSTTLATDVNAHTDEVTIATTGNTDTHVVAPYNGSLASADCSGTSALAASDTNYVTFSVTNLGQAGAGSTLLLAATDPNTTKATGGTALSANTKRSLTVHGTAANLVVTSGDRLRFRFAATGTLAGAVTGFRCVARFTRTS